MSRTGPKANALTYATCITFNPVARRIYVDFDDVLCETARAFLNFVEREFGRRYEFEDIRSFNIGESFDLNADEYERFMRLAHVPEALASMAPIPGAIETLNEWAANGAEVRVVTGRPPDTESVCREWLSAKGLNYVSLVFMDKYGRSHMAPEGTVVHSLADLAGMDFDLAVEDAPTVIEYLVKNTDFAVAVLDRPWNRALELPSVSDGRRVVRCSGWPEVAERFASLF